MERSQQTTQSASYFRPELDALRFIAFLLVFIFHGVIGVNGWFNSLRISGAYGVCLFFFLSSFLITELLQREFERTGNIHIRSFYIRRILRIWPLYFLLLISDFILHRALHAQSFPAARFVAFFFLLGNWYETVHGAQHTLSGLLWTITVEEQFYLVWPNIRKFFRTTGQVIVAIVMLFGSYVAIWYLTARHVDVDVGIWANSFVQFQFFASGALLAILLHRRTFKLQPILRVLFFVAGILLFATAQDAFHGKLSGAPLPFTPVASSYLLVNIGVVLIFLSFLGAKIARSNPLVYLGKISYGLYIYHSTTLRVAIDGFQPVARRLALSPFTANMIEVTAAFSLTVTVAHLSYRFLESPILKYKKRFEYVHSRPV